MRAERLGSYSMVATTAGMPVLSRLKSIARILRLCPPPRCQMVRLPELRRPPVRFFGSVSGLCGRFVVRSSFTCELLKRRVGVIGLYVLIAIVALFVLHFQAPPNFQLGLGPDRYVLFSRPACRATGSARTRASSRPRPTARRPSSNPGGSR